MLSKVKYTAPELENDTEVIIELTTEKNGFESDPVEVTLTAKGFEAPSAPVITGASEVQENQTLTLNYTVDPKATLKGQASKGTLTIGETIEFVAPEVESDEGIALSFYAQRGSKVSETVTKTISVKNVMVKSDTLTTSSATTVGVDSTIDIEFDNAVGTLNVTEVSAGIETQIIDGKVRVTGKTEGRNSFKVSQTEAGKLESDPITVDITVTTKAEKSETLTIDSADISVSLTTDAEGKVISFNNATGTLNLTVVSGEEFGTATVEEQTIKVVPISAGSMELSVTQTQDTKTESEPLTLNITIE